MKNWQSNPRETIIFRNSRQKNSHIKMWLPNLKFVGSSLSACQASEFSHNRLLPVNAFPEPKQRDSKKSVPDENRLWMKQLALTLGVSLWVKPTQEWRNLGTGQVVNPALAHTSKSTGFWA